MAEQMIDIEYLKQLLELFDGSTVNDLRIEREGVEIRLSKSPRREEPTAVHYTSIAPPPVAATATPAVPTVASGTATPTHAPVEETPAATAAPNAAADARTSCAVCPTGFSELIAVLAPMPGTVYLAPSPGAPPFVQPGQMVTAGQTLCIIEAMKLMNEIESEVAGCICEVLVQNGQPVEFGQELFIIAVYS